MTSIERARAGKVEKVLAKRINVNGREMSTREFLDQLIREGGALKVFRERRYEAEEKEAEHLRRLANHVPFGNPNHPETIEYNALKAALKAGIYKERTGVQLPNGTFYEMNKTEVEYFEKNRR